MQSGKHTGKLVLNMRDSTPLSVLDHRPLFSPNATYIVTGGMGDFGLRFLAYPDLFNIIAINYLTNVRFLYEKGARNVLLTDYDVKRRRTPQWVKKELKIADDMNIMIEYANVHTYSDVERVVKLCSERNLPPLRGVFHLAAVLAEGSLLVQDRELYHIHYK
jgi:KR domain